MSLAISHAAGASPCSSAFSAARARPAAPLSSAHQLTPRLAVLRVGPPFTASPSRASPQMSASNPPSAAGAGAAAPAEGKEQKLWGGRFEEAVTPAVERFGQSVSYDQKLYRFDIQGSKAHAAMLAQQGLMTVAERDAIVGGLEEIERRIEAGTFEWRADREDVHMNIEAALTDLVGEPAKKLHTARSRNDQVCTDVRLWCRDAIAQLLDRIARLQAALVRLADGNAGLVVPGYTHLQRAQPLLLAHVLLAYVEMLERDAGRLRDCGERLNFSPLGSCALAGTGLPIDRHLTASALGFSAPLRNSVDAVSDRDFLIELLAANSIIAVHLSRLAEEWVLWASEEFGFVTPSDRVSTGSSIMPQKKNPDPMELVRGKAARVIGDLTTVLVLCKGLPLAYNRDLQEDKEPLFDSVETVLASLEVTAEFAANVTFNRPRIEQSLPAGHLDATTLADYLVYKGMPFRTSHDVVGRAVAIAVARGVELSALSLEELRAINPIFEGDVYSFLGVHNSITKFTSFGSTGAARVDEQLKFWRDKLQL
ncbi:unnamed protein product [Closterium sp. NIES-64]|nr:unnamed protein product [Closterium sp. Naga37s-1]CAI5948696.1 unnamed protein product [Closterium sp. NIES-65]CAI5978914.1 unnamed protein product [Closterium sp. NIES-64]